MELFGIKCSHVRSGGRQFHEEHLNTIQRDAVNFKAGIKEQKEKGEALGWLDIPSFDINYGVKWCKGKVYESRR